MAKSWLDDEKTVRKYRFLDGIIWVVQNEYRPVNCPNCNEVQYCRLTHIWHYDQQGRCRPEYHVNFDTALRSLKKLLVTYIDGVGVTEAEIDGKWSLVKGGERIGEEEM